MTNIRVWSKINSYLCPCEQYVIKFFYVVASKATILKVCAEPLGFSDPRTALC